MNVFSKNNFMDIIEEILKKYCVFYDQIFSTMYAFGIDSEHLYGYMSLTEADNVLCRFYYDTDVNKYITSFIFNEDLFKKELKKANDAYIKVKNKAIDDVLNKI